MSYKLDIRGENKFIYGMEEMSIKNQCRNFSWEILYHEVLKANGVLALNIVPIKLYRIVNILEFLLLKKVLTKNLLKNSSEKMGL